ncbi:MAG: HemK2/MTQ2 family protein methyltransferase [Haloarculaceae archaeon]
MGEADGEGDGGATAERSRPALADRRDLDTVYQPAEDSRLLADAAVDDVGAEDYVLEVGTGSGYVADRIASETGATVVGVDLNRGACEATRERGIPIVRGDLVSPFRADAFDVVCSNPPYLPTPPEMEWDDAMEAALSGGVSGRAVVEPFLDTVGRVLAPGGRALLLVSTLTDLDAVKGYAAEQGLESSVLAAESHPYERLVVFRLVPSPEGARSPGNIQGENN